MLLKAQTFGNARDGITAVEQIQRRSLDKIRQIQRLYDREVHPEQGSGQSRGPIQMSWDRSIQAAFSQARSDPTQAPDGTIHRVRFIDVLAQSGRNV